MGTTGRRGGAMFIQTEATGNPNVMKFFPGEPVLDAGEESFSGVGDAMRSPLAQCVFAVEFVQSVSFGTDFVSVEKKEDADWQLMKPAILGAIMEHYVAGVPVVISEVPVDDTIEEDFDPDDAAIVAEIKELLTTRVKPAIAESGGDVRFRGYKEGRVIVEMLGSAYGYRTGIENLLRHYVVEFSELVDYRDSKPKPGLETAEGKAVQKLLDERINPSVSTHGGHIALVDVKDDTAYIRLEGGCQGCGMADVTLKQGVEVEIQKEIPSIAHVLDVTDHAGGGNPYYQPGK
jgi:Fe-S cluster biogenesis protein NfuA